MLTLNLRRMAAICFLAFFSLLVAGCAPGSGEDSTSIIEPPPPPPQGTSVGCYSASYNGLDVSQLGCGLISTFGDPFFDQRFQQEINIQTTFWQGVPATVYAFDECSAQYANAIAMPNRNILMGYWLTQKIVFNTGSELPVAGVLAHEWGHQIQFQNGWAQPTEPTVRRIELEADMFSGFYMALAKGWTGPELNSYFQNLFSTGDYNFHNRSHHGTPNQRLAAGTYGYQVGVQMFFGGQPLTYVELHQIFDSEVTRIVNSISATDAVSKPGGSSDQLSYVAAQVVGNVDTTLQDEILAGTGSPDQIDIDLSGIPEELRLLYGPY